jgi:exonuclease III
MFFHNLYGWRHNDYMGIGIAIPVSMELKSMSVIKIGDHIRSFSKPRNKKIKATTGESHWNKSGTEIDTESISDPWETSMAKYNTLICVHVVVHDKPLFIGTYHMPSCYKEPDVMAIHASVVKDLMFQLAAGKNFILAGDFNITPGEVCYKTLTEKDYTNWNLPESSIYEISYRPLKEQILKSAYREKNGAEPAYTDYSHTLDSPNYCETIDYIFFNGRLTVQDVLELPNYPTGESYPDATHPSDHLMIAATFQLL